MDPEKQRKVVLGSVGLAVVAVAAYVFLVPKEEELPSAPGAIYYTGPMKSKSGSNEYADINGQPMSEEAAKAARDQWLKDHPEVADMEKKAL